ncbi:MAG TPA: ferritin-like domain-containing protein [Burkholderiales bacterium]|nr:ferritin-like domain-containing protein [Burkholderiales bacterium]
MKVGSQVHKELFCRDFIDTHQRFEPNELPWPKLDDKDIGRLRAVPFWQEVFHTERRAGAIVAAFAETVHDPLLRETIDLQGFEEARHARLIRFMIDQYGLDATERPLEPLPDDIETAFIDFGYGECLDAFLGFGVFKIARDSGFLPDAMFSVFDILMLEETRHIVFFVNWMAYREALHGRGFAPLRAVTAAKYYGRAVQRLVGTIRTGAEGDGQEFSATQANIFLEGFSIKKLLANCLTENKRRMSQFDQRLLRPQLLPTLGRLVFSGMKLWPSR